jgi:hypothetical protein
MSPILQCPGPEQLCLATLGEPPLREARVARVYTPKDFDVSRIMGDIVDVVAEHHGVAAVP